MLKPILLASLFSLNCYYTGAAYAAPSPVPLLVEQCLRLPSIDLAAAFTHARLTTLPVNSALSLAQQALILEQQTLGLNNINDRLNYYRGFKLMKEEREGLLQCQLHLADTLSQLVRQTEFSQLTNALSQGNREQIQLSQQLKVLLQQDWPVEEKAKLHTAQASVRQGLMSQQLHLAFNYAQCQLKTETQAETAEGDLTNRRHVDFSNTIASYLMQQENPVCRQNMWQTYQARASERNQSALQRIAAQRLHAATQAGFTDHASFSLSTQQLSSPELVKTFLDSQTQNMHIAPWDLGRALAHQAAANGPSQQTAQILAQSVNYLQDFGLQFEPLDASPANAIPADPKRANIIRVYHQQRLLGELYVSYHNSVIDNSSSEQQTLRQSVIGQQFGQHALDLKPQLDNYKDIEQFSEALAEAVTSLAQGSHFYLNNAMGQSQDSQHLPSLWLAESLRQALFPEFEHTYVQRRESLARDYAKQLKVFRAKVALHFYQHPSEQGQSDLADSDLAAEFRASFGHDWPDVNDYPYSFNAIANEGPLYYQSLWQTALAQLIHRATADCQDKLSLFNLLVVNEAALSLDEQLSTVLGEDSAPTSLIQRIASASSYRSATNKTMSADTITDDSMHSASRCTF
jgi:predicted metal-dependent phosphoesterase TrpH